MIACGRRWPRAQLRGLAKLAALNDQGFQGGVSLTVANSSRVRGPRRARRRRSAEPPTNQVVSRATRDRPTVAPAGGLAAVATSFCAEFVLAIFGCGRTLDDRVIAADAAGAARLRATGSRKPRH